jgi:hypothetical protein
MKSFKINTGDNGSIEVEIDGVYHSEVNDYGMVSFERSFEYDSGEYGGVVVNGDNWMDVLGEEHLLVELFEGVEGSEVEVGSDYVMVILSIDKLCEYLLEIAVAIKHSID